MAGVVVARTRSAKALARVNTKSLFISMSDCGAEVLATGFPFVRVDLYEVDGRPRFGELTFYPASGYLRPVPDTIDRLYGDLWPTGLPSGPAASV